MYPKILIKELCTCVVGHHMNYLSAKCNLHKACRTTELNEGNTYGEPITKGGASTVSFQAFVVPKDPSS